MYSHVFVNFCQYVNICIRMCWSTEKWMIIFRKKCMYTSVFVNMYQHVIVNTYVNIYVYVCVWQNMSVFKYVYVYVFVNRDVDDNRVKEMESEMFRLQDEVRVYTHTICTCLYICICTYIHVHIHIHIHTRTRIYTYANTYKFTWRHDVWILQIVGRGLSILHACTYDTQYSRISPSHIGMCGSEVYACIHVS